MGSPTSNNALREVEHQAAGTPLNDWLAEMGLIPGAHTDFEILLHNDWQRLGAETYTMDFSVATADMTTKLIAKACVKLPVIETMREWLSRRYMLAEHGIHTPHLFGHDQATLIEEFIPYTLHEAFMLAGEGERTEMKAELETVFKTLFCLGFKPHLSASDFRSRGSDIVIIDFGEDLGGIAPTDSLDEEDVNMRSAKYAHQVLASLDA